VRSERSGELIPLASLVTVTEWADSRSLNRYNRLRAITLEANLEDRLPLGAALDYLEGLVREHLPEQARVDYKGQSRDFRTGTAGVAFVFLLGLVVVYLVLAAQFESWVHPLVIMLTVPLAMAGALLALWLSGQSLNLYSEIGLIFAEAGKLTGVRVYKNEKKSDAFFARSDNQALADVGVPAHTFLVVYEFPDYHRPGDEWHKLDYANMAKVVRTAALGVLMIANNPEPPKWNEANPKAAPYLKAWKERKGN
ncbi:MAG TPA: efflux RND transporter permease subunit, partial [Bryobacteraceae bacterium]|nr:efflux RND transporter permease subunit [Bryobacteraceae bacterium]